MDYLLTAAKENGVSVAYNAEVIAIKKNSDGYRVTIKNNGEIVEIKALIVINCAGLDSDIIASMIGVDILKEKYNLHYCKGQYFRVSSDKSRLVGRLVVEAGHALHHGIGDEHIAVGASLGQAVGPANARVGEPAGVPVGVQKRTDHVPLAVRFDQGQ